MGMTAMTCCSGGGERQITGGMVLVCVVAFFAVVAGVNGVMLAAAITTFGGVETGSSYQAGRVFARETSAVQAQNRLGWKVTVTVPAGAAGMTTVEVAARDQADEPLSGLRADGRLSHPLDKRLDRALTWNEIGPGVFRAETMHVAGQWDLSIELSQDGLPKFRSRNRLTLR